jgi:hypothetical protein
MFGPYAKRLAEIDKCEARTVANQCAPILKLYPATQLVGIQKGDPNLLPSLI